MAAVSKKLGGSVHHFAGGTSPVAEAERPIILMIGWLACKKVTEAV